MRGERLQKYRVKGPVVSINDVHKPTTKVFDLNEYEEDKNGNLVYASSNIKEAQPEELEHWRSVIFLERSIDKLEVEFNKDKNRF